MERNRMNICLSRQNFRILCEESPEYMKELESSVNARIDAIQRQYPTMSTMRCALLAMLNMEDDISKARKDTESLEEKLMLLRGLPLNSVNAQPSPANAEIKRSNAEEGQPVGI